MKRLFLLPAGLLIVASVVNGAQSQPAASDPHSKAASERPMMASMRAEEAKLDDLVAQLNAARGDDRVDKLIAVVRELVAERKRMRDGMAGRGGMMMNPAATAPDAGAADSAHHAEHGR
jgi:hypothetical protein